MLINQARYYGGTAEPPANPDTYRWFVFECERRPTRCGYGTESEAMQMASCLNQSSRDKHAGYRWRIETNIAKLHNLRACGIVAWTLSTELLQRSQQQEGINRGTP